jgi:hypothetical protein
MSAFEMIMLIVRFPFGLLYPLTDFHDAFGMNIMLVEVSYISMEDGRT